MPRFQLLRRTLRPTSWQFFLGLAVASGAGAPGLAAQEVRCDTPCLNSGVSVSGKLGTVGPTSSARELLERMAAAYQERIASVDNYLVVQSSYILSGQGTLSPDSGDGPPPTPPPAPTAGEAMPVGPPAVLYFEKQQVAGRSAFVGVPPSELAKRENHSMGGPELGELASVLGEAMKMLPEGLRSMVSEDELRNAITGVNPEDRQQAFMVDNFWSEHQQTLVDRARRVRVDTINGQPLAVLHASDLRDLDVDPGFEVESATLWVGTNETGDPVPRILRVHGWQTTAGGPRPLTIQRYYDDYRWVGPMYEPFKVTDIMAGMGDAAKGALGEAALGLDRTIYTVATVVKSLKHNTGPPTQAETAKYVREGWDKSGNQWNK